MLPVPDADGTAGDAGQRRRLGGRALLPGPMGAHHQGAQYCTGTSALCTDRYCYIIVRMQPAVCACVCHRVELCSNDVARFSSEINALQPT